jgi:hypothetical protein
MVLQRVAIRRVPVNDLVEVPPWQAAAITGRLHWTSADPQGQLATETAFQIFTRSSKCVVAA